MKEGQKDRIVFWLFLTPVLIAFLVVVIIPFLIGVFYSFTDWSAVPGKSIHFIGLENFKQVFRDVKFGNSFRVTTLYTIMTVILTNLVGFLLAILVTQKFKTNNLLRTLFFMPNLIGGLILGFIWKFIFLKISPSITELLFNDANLFNWLAQPKLALFSMVIVSTWQMGGYIMIIYIAAIQSIPESFIEAANIDGASGFHKLIYIIFPLVAQAFTISLFFTLSTSFKMFDVNLALTNGGPVGSTELLTLNIYSTAFSNLRFGFGQAKAIIFFFIVTVITLIQVFISKKREVAA